MQKYYRIIAIWVFESISKFNINYNKNLIKLGIERTLFICYRIYMKNLCLIVNLMVKY